MANKKIKSFAQEENGAASILVILMMIVLVSLGYFAIASANSNINLSKVSLDWNEKYYYLDREGEKFLALVDERLYTAQEKANNYLQSESYLNYTHQDLPLELHMSIHDGYAETSDKDFFLEQVMDIVFLFYADLELTSLSQEYPEAAVSSLKDENLVHGVICDLTLTHPEAQYYHLDISLSVNNYSIFANKQKEGKYDVRRYKVINWTQWQNQPNEDKDSNLWDGTIIIP